MFNLIIILIGYGLFIIVLVIIFLNLVTFSLNFQIYSICYYLLRVRLQLLIFELQTRYCYICIHIAAFTLLLPQSHSAGCLCLRFA